MTNAKKILPFGILIICLSSFIIANIIISPPSFTVNEDISFRYNISINNTDIGNITSVNITLPSGFVYTAGTNFTTNSSTVIFSNTSDTLIWFNETAVIYEDGQNNISFSFNATMATAGAWHNITVIVANSTGGLNSTNISVYVNDTTFPLVSFVTPVTQANLSDSYVINISITDDTPSKVYFNITNSSGVQNTSSLVASRIGTSTYWNATINTSAYSDGIYNITIYVNDSNNQLNSTIYKVIRIDNTNPTNTQFYCTPNAVYTGETVTCYCEGAADSGSGLLSTTYTTNPSTATVGTFTETCTMVDRAGNSYAPTTTYTVSNSPGGSSPASGGGSSTTQTWTNTYTVTSEQFEQGYTKAISANERVKIMVGNEDHHVGVKKVTITSATIEIASTPVEIILDVGETAKVDVDEDGIYDIYVILNNIVDGKADITIKKIIQEVPEGEESVSTTGEIQIPEETAGKDYTFVWIIVGILILIAIGAGYKFRPKKK